MEIIMFIAFIGVLIALITLRKPIETTVNEWIEERELELKKRREKLLKKDIETGVVTEKEIQEWKRLGIDAFERSSERQSARLKAKFEELDEMFAGKKK